MKTKILVRKKSQASSSLEPEVALMFKSELTVFGLLCGSQDHLKPLRLLLVELGASKTKSKKRKVHHDKVFSIHSQIRLSTVEEKSSAKCTLSIVHLNPFAFLTLSNDFPRR